MGYVYLVQPVVLIGTKRYKIGMSALADQSRIKSYGNGTRCICILECEDHRNVEQKLINAFNDAYTLIGGNEYFEVDDELPMLNLFIKTVMDHKNHKPDVEELRALWMSKFGRL